MVSIIAGDSHTWRLLPVRYLNPKEIPKDAAWSAFFNPAEGQEQPALLVERSGDFVVIIMPPEVSENLSGKSGDVLLQVSGKNLRKTFLVEEVSIVSLENSRPASFKSRARQCLEAAQRALETYTGTNGHVKSYTIGSRSMTFNSPQELFDLIEYWKKQVFLEECRARGVDPHTLLVEFR